MLHPLRIKSLQITEGILHTMKTIFYSVLRFNQLFKILNFLTTVAPNLVVVSVHKMTQL